MTFNRKTRRRNIIPLIYKQVADNRYTLMIYKAWAGEIPAELMAEIDKCLLTLTDSSTELEMYAQIQQGVGVYNQDLL